MSQLFSNIAKLIPTLHGWGSVGKAQSLAAAVIALRPAVSLELGVWGGRLTLAMAMAHKEIGTGMVYAIDPWSPVESAKGQANEADRDYWSKVDHELVMNDFLKNVSLQGVTDCVKVFRQRSDDAIPPDNISVMSLDGNHGETSIRDAQRYGPKVRSGGLLFLDDIDWSGGNVRKAFEELKRQGFYRLYDMDTGCVMQKQ